MSKYKKILRFIFFLSVTFLTLLYLLNFFFLYLVFMYSREDAGEIFIGLTLVNLVIICIFSIVLGMLALKKYKYLGFSLASAHVFNFTVIAILALSILFLLVGPSLNKVLKTDTFVEQTINGLNEELNFAVMHMGEDFPKDLRENKAWGKDAHGIVELKVDTLPPKIEPDGVNTKITRYYELCASFKNNKNYPKASRIKDGVELDYVGYAMDRGYSFYIDTESHPKGYYCFKAMTR